MTLTTVNVHLDPGDKIALGNHNGASWIDVAGVCNLFVSDAATGRLLVEAAREMVRLREREEAAAARQAANEAAAAETTEVDSESWTCLGPCHGSFAGGRPVGDVCNECAAAALAAAPVSAPAIPAVAPAEPHGVMVAEIGPAEVVAAVPAAGTPAVWTVEASLAASAARDDLAAYDWVRAGLAETRLRVAAVFPAAADRAELAAAGDLAETAAVSLAASTRALLAEIGGESRG